jgi:hypothetical protein
MRIEITNPIAVCVGIAMLVLVFIHPELFVSVLDRVLVMVGHSKS